MTKAKWGYVDLALRLATVVWPIGFGFHMFGWEGAVLVSAILGAERGAR